MLIIEDNLCNNYCNISLNNTCRDLYINEPLERGEGKKILRKGQFFRKRELNKKTLKDKKTLNPFSLLELFLPLLANQSSPDTFFCPAASQTNQELTSKPQQPHTLPSISPIATPFYCLHTLSPLSRNLQDSFKKKNITITSKAKQRQ